jgi:hypothetical protein
VLPFKVAPDSLELVDKEQSKDNEGNEYKRKNDVEYKRELHWRRPQKIKLLSVFHISFRLSRLKYGWVFRYEFNVWSASFEEGDGPSKREADRNLID